MTIQVSLASSSLPWRFRDSSDLETWIGDRGWRGTSGCVVLGIAHSHLALEFGQRVIDLLLLAEGPGADCVPVEVEPDEGRPSFWGSVSQAMGLDDSEGYWPFLRTVGQLVSEPRFLLVSADGDPVSTVEQARAFVTDLGKAAPSCPLTIVLPVARTFAGCDRDWDLGVGAPCQPALDSLDLPDPVLWRRYVHHRLAWETGGDLERARSWDAAGIGSIASGDDAALERKLNECAMADLNAVPSEVAEHWNTSVQADPRGQVAAPKGSLGSELERLGLWWRPIHTDRLRPSPWAARAALLGSPNGLLRPWLRSCLACAPLAREIMNRCSDMESLERSRLARDLRSASPKQETHQLYDRYKEPGDFLQRTYPPLSPARPHDVWDFASYGEILIKTQMGRGYREDLRQLRNTLAHGHPPTWFLIQRLRTVERQVGA